MSEWGFALQVGGIGFGLVFFILVVLYLALSIVGKLSVRLSTARARAAGKAPGIQPDKAST